MKTKKKTGDKYKNKVMTGGGEKIRKELWFDDSIYKIFRLLAAKSDTCPTPKEYMEMVLINHATEAEKK